MFGQRYDHHRNDVMTWLSPLPEQARATSHDHDMTTMTT
jgi:hypothetical protein